MIIFYDYIYVKITSYSSYVNFVALMWTTAISPLASSLIFAHMDSVSFHIQNFQVGKVDLKREKYHKWESTPSQSAVAVTEYSLHCPQ